MCKKPSIRLSAEFSGKTLQTKEKTDLYTENCKILMKEIEKDTHKNRKIARVLGSEELTLKCSYYAKLISGFNTITIKILMAFLK